MSVDIGQILIDSGRIGPQHLEQAKAHAAQKGCELDRAFLDLELLDEDGLASALSSHYDIPGFSLARMPKPNPNTIWNMSPEPKLIDCTAKSWARCSSLEIWAISWP